MDKMILISGIALMSLGLGFLMAPYAGDSLNNAFTSGGILWLGGLTMGLGLKVKREKTKQLGALRQS